MGTSSPTPEQVLPFFDLKKKHVHQDMVSGGDEQVPPNENYELAEGTKAVAKTRRGKAVEITRTVAQQPSKLVWAKTLRRHYGSPAVAGEFAGADSR